MLVDLVVLVREQAEAGGVAQQLAVDPVRDARVHGGQFLQVHGFREPFHPAPGEHLSHLERVAADGGDVLLPVGPALFGAGELGEGGQGGGFGGFAEGAGAVDPALVGGPAQGAGRGGRGRAARDGVRAAVPAGGAQGSGEVLGRGDGLSAGGGGRRYGDSLPVVVGGGGGAVAGGLGECGLGQRRREDGGDVGAGHGRRGAQSGEVLGADGPGDPGAVEDAAFVGLGDEVLGLVVVAVGGLDGPQVDGDAVLLGGHQAGQQVAVAGHEDHVGAGAVAGELGELGVHGGVDALLGPAAVAAGQGAEADGDPGHDAQPAVFGLGHPVGCAVEPVDAQQGLLGVGFGPLPQALDEGGMVDGDPGAGGLPGEKAGGGAQQVAGVHQDDAAVHAFHPLPWGSPCRFPGFPESARPQGC